MRLTPNGRSVRAAVAAISVASKAGVMAPQAMTPKPPAFEIAATRLRSDTQVMAPPITAASTPRNARPRRHRRSRRLRARLSASACIEAVGGMEGAHRELGIFVGDEHA